MKRGRAAADEVGAALSGVGRERELAHGAQLGRRAVGERLGKMGGSDSGLAASAAIVSATRRDLARPRPESGRRSTARSSSSVASFDHGPAETRSTRAPTRRARAPAPMPRSARRRARQRADAASRRRGRTGRAAPARACRGTQRVAVASTCTRPQGRPALRRDTGSSPQRAGSAPGRRPPSDARDADDAVLERLAERLERGPLELGELVQDEHSPVREADLSRPRPGAASDQRRDRGVVVRRAKRPGRDQRPVRTEHPGDRVDPRHLERLAVESGGRIPGSRRASIVFPVPGGPASRRLCPPAAAISRARRARSWPRTSARSGCGSSGG